MAACRVPFRYSATADGIPCGARVISPRGRTQVSAAAGRWCRNLFLRKLRQGPAVTATRRPYTPRPAFPGIAPWQMAEQRFSMVAQATKDVIRDWDILSQSMWLNDNLMSVVIGNAELLAEPLGDREDLLAMANRGPSPAEKHHEPGRARSPTVSRPGHAVSGGNAAGRCCSARRGSRGPPRDPPRGWAACPVCRPSKPATRPSPRGSGLAGRRASWSGTRRSKRRSPPRRARGEARRNRPLRSGRPVSAAAPIGRAATRSRRRDMCPHHLPVTPFRPARPPCGRSC